MKDIVRAMRTGTQEEGATPVDRKSSISKVLHKHEDVALVGGRSCRNQWEPHAGSLRIVLRNHTHLVQSAVTSLTAICLVFYLDYELHFSLRALKTCDNSKPILSYY